MTPSAHERGRLPGYLVAVLLALAVAVGCAGRSTPGTPLHLVGKPWQNADGSPPARDGDTDTVAGLSHVLAGRDPPPQADGRPLNMLIMSGGGKYGAFTAGIINGWTKSGTRPTFDVCTGVSSGAMIATLAYLGPKYDQQMAQYFTTLQRSSVYAWRPVRGLITRTGVMTADPLARIIGGAVTDEFLCDLRAAYAEGRRLYVGTGETRTNRVAVWDIGAIASSGRPDARDLIVKILTAACAPPGVVQPIKIDVEVNGCRFTEMHADAGNILQGDPASSAG